MGLNSQAWAREASQRDERYADYLRERNVSKFGWKMATFADCPRFIWVEVWLNALLPLLNKQKNITDKAIANQLLAEMKNSAVHSEHADKQLEAGFRRLWSFNEYIGLLESRDNLFRLVLCAIRPLTSYELTEALRIRLDEDRSYKEDLTLEQVKLLYSNFLKENADGSVGFFHDSARSFVVNMKESRGTVTKDLKNLQFSKERNHLYAVKLYIQIMKPPAHQIWTQGRHPIPLNSTQIYSMMQRQYIYSIRGQTGLPGANSFLVYMGECGLRHCQLAAAKNSISDELWAEVLDKVILCSNPSPGFIWSLLGLHEWVPVLSPSLSNSVAFNTLSGQVDVFGALDPEGFTLFYSHIVALLDIISPEDFSEKQLRDLAQDFQSMGDHKRRLRLLLKHASQGGNHTCTALHIASAQGNAAAVELFLSGTYYIHGAPAVLELLSTERRGNVYGPTAFSLAAETKDVAILEILLNYEMKCTRKAGSDLSQGSTQVSRIAQQWSHSMAKSEKEWSLPIDSFSSYDTVFLDAVRTLGEEEMCRLLEIGRPPDINIKDTKGLRALDIANISGYQQLARVLVELSDVDDT
jgi:hypothetical protein